MNSSEFYQLRATGPVPEGLSSFPEVLWVPKDVTLPFMGTKKVLIEGVSPTGAKIPVLYKNENHYEAGVNILKLSQLILNEEYHSGLHRTVEMRLPISYMSVPLFIRNLGRLTLKSRFQKRTQIPFPSESNPPVDWLKKLASEKKRAWPVSGKSPFVLTYDVDTDWLFNNPYWLTKFLELHERLGVKGVWFTVPTKSCSETAEKGLALLRQAGEEIGCHGYNHDARWPFVSQKEFVKRLNEVRKFKEKWGIKSFRSEWLWRSSAFITEIAKLFEYDSSIPTESPFLTSFTRNGCGTQFPFRTFGGILEFPLTLPMDDRRVFLKQGPETFFVDQEKRANEIFKRNALVVSSVHPQSHQLANPKSFSAYEKFVERLVSNSRSYNTTFSELGPKLK